MFSSSCQSRLAIKFSFTIHLCDGCIYIISRYILVFHLLMQSHSLVHVCCIRDARTYRFPPSVGLAQARPGSPQ